MYQYLSMKNASIGYLLVALALCVWAYYPGLSGTFIFDDVANISDNNFLKIEQFSFEELWQATWSGYSGPLKRPVSMLSFSINHLFTGMDPLWMKITNLVIHIFNAIVLLFLCKELLPRLNGINQKYLFVAPYIISGLWLVHPINVTSVSYIVQRMTSLSAGFILIAMYFYLKLRNSGCMEKKHYLFGLLVLISWLFGLLSKETALSLSIYIFVIEWCVYNFRTNSKSEKKYLLILLSLIALPWVIGLAYIAYDPSHALRAYNYREFTITERVLTEFRIVVDYLKLILVPDIRNMGLYHDDLIISKSILSPLSTLLCILLVMSSLCVAVIVKKRFPLICLGILWFFGGHLLESTIYPLELVFMHRNYLPSIGILFVLIGLGVGIYQNYRNLFKVIITLVLLAFSICTHSLAVHWSGDYRMLVLEAMNHPNSVRANFRAGQVFKVYAITVDEPEQKAQYREEAFKYFDNIRELNKKEFSGELGKLETYLQLKVEPPQEFIEELVSGLYSSKLDVSIISILKSVKNCIVAGGCLLSAEDYHRVLEAALNNRYMTGDIRRRLLIIHAEYLAKGQGNIDAAITTVLEALIVHPTPDDLMILALYYEEGGYPEQVERTINYLETQDKYGRFNKFIKEVRERL